MMMARYQAEVKAASIRAHGPLQMSAEDQEKLRQDALRTLLQQMMPKEGEQQHQPAAQAAAPAPKAVTADDPLPPMPMLVAPGTNRSTRIAAIVAKATEDKMGNKEKAAILGISGA